MWQHATNPVEQQQEDSWNSELIRGLTRILSPHFELERDAVVCDRPVPLVARSRVTVQHYTLSKKLVLEESRLFDTLYFWTERPPLSGERLEEYFGCLCRLQAETSRIPANHFRSRFVGIVLVPGFFASGLRKQVRRYHHFRWLRFGFGGMTESLLLVYDWRTGNWFGNRRGREFAPLLARLRLEVWGSQNLPEEE